MNWDDLRIFLKVARKQKFSDAAIELKMDETTVSRRIKRLEEDLGTTLFERSKRGNFLTISGKKLLAKTEEIELTASSINEKNTNQNQLHGTIRISAAEGFGATIFADLICEFHKKHPNIEIDLVSGSGFLSLSRREADVAIGLSKSKSKLVKSNHFFDYELGLYSSKDWQYDEGQSLSSLSQETLISYVDDLIYAPELRYFEEIFPNFRPKLRCTSIIAKRHLVENGAGLAILPIFMENEKIKRIFKSQISIKRTFWISVHKGIEDTRRYIAFSNFAKKYMESFGYKK